MRMRDKKMMHCTFDKAQYLLGQDVRIRLPGGALPAEVAVYRLEQAVPCDWRAEDGELVLSVAAAEIILKHYDEQRAAENAANDCGGYDKTKFLIHYTDETGKSGTYEGRYDLGDNDGGLIAHIRSFAETVTGEDAQNIRDFASMLEKFTKPGQEAAETAQNSGEIVRVEVSPLLEQAAARVRERRKQAEQETEEIMESLNLLTDEQLARAVLLTDPKNPDQANVGRVFLQKLDARDHDKAMKLYRYWQTGGAA